MMTKITREVIVRFFLTGDDLMFPDANQIKQDVESVIEEWVELLDCVDCDLWLLRVVIDDILWERG